VVAKGMAALYKAQPKNPVDFLAKWLLNYCHVQKQSGKQGEEKEFVKEMMEKKAYADMAAAQVAEEKQEVKDEEQAKIDKFNHTVSKSVDLVDEF
jgi:hypothetical protein